MRLLFIALLLIASPAFSQTITPKTVNVTLAPHGNSAQSIGLKFSVPDVVNGCWRVSELAHETGMQDPHYFDVDIQSYTREQGPCDTDNKQPIAIVPIEKSLLEAGKIKVLRLSVGPTIDRYNVTYEDGIMRILPASQAIFKTAQELVHNFDRSNSQTGTLIALIVPTAPAGVDTAQAVADFAMMNSLTLAPESATSSLPSANGGSQIHYYHDRHNAVASRVTNEFSQIGGTSVPMTYDLPDGRGQEFVAAPIYAKKVD